MSDFKYTWLEFIKYVLGFIFGRWNKKKQEEKKSKEKFKEISEDLKDNYDAIDKKKEAEKKKDVKERLNNIF